MANVPAQEIPDEFRSLLDVNRSVVLALRLSDGETAPAALVSPDGRILGQAKGPKGPGGSPPPIDVRWDEVVEARKAKGLPGFHGWRRRGATGELQRRIRAWSPDPGDRFAHLDPLLRFLVMQGNRVAADDRSGRGRRVTLIEPIDFVSLRAEFELPGSIELHPSHDAIVCRNTGSEILGTRGARR
jgi:hypothetical protein